MFPAVIAHGSEPGNTFSLKSGSTVDLAGLEVGLSWPNNLARGLPRHHSTILLMDQDSGRVGAVIEGAATNAYRSAAADAVAARTLARPDSESLAIFGAANQALFECAALARVLPLKRLHVAARLPEQGIALDVRLSSAEETCQGADVVVTATPARHPLFEADWIRPGTHVASMGSDRKGKRELPAGPFERAKLFCDLPSPSVEIGEFQHVRGRVADGSLVLNAIGAVLAGRCEGRTAADEVTVFDGSSIALQDQYIAQHLLAMVETQTASR